MEPDLFEREQSIHDKAVERLDEMKNGTSYSDNDFKWEVLVKEYGRMLKHLRRVTKSSDKATYESMLAKDRAEAVAEARASFLANMSHEIRTPMNGVIGLTDLALDDESISEKQRGYLFKIKRCSDGLLAIINDILDISKIDAGELTLENIPFDLRLVFMECQTVIAQKAEEKGLELFFYNETSLARKIIGDPTRLRQALLNFLSNAIKFTKTGSVTLRAKSEISAKGDTVTIDFDITDTGIGMTEEQCAKIFEPFKQADDSTTRNFGGTGLGLSITKNIIEMMGGEVHVESAWNAGSRFFFTIEFEFSSEMSTPVGYYTNQNASADRPAFAGEVLLCDDNETNQLVATENLKKLGFTVTVADNGKIAVGMVRAAAKPFEAIFMDMHMPVMDGLQATRELLQMGVQTPIIAMTANAMAEDREKCLNAGMTDYITKPFRPHELWSCLLKYLKPVENSGRETRETVITPPEPRFNFDSNAVIDKDKGLAYLGGNEKVYGQLLAKFLKEQPEMFISLEKAIAEKDCLLANRLAHTMKGISATIGAVKLPEYLNFIEQAFADGASGGCNGKMLEACKAELDNVLASILALNLPLEEHLTTDGVLDMEKASRLIGRIKPLLEKYISLNDEQIETVREVLSPIGEQCDILVSQLDEYDLESALDTLGEIEASLFS